MFSRHLLTTGVCAVLMMGGAGSAQVADYGADSYGYGETYGPTDFGDEYGYYDEEYGYYGGDTRLYNDDDEWQRDYVPDRSDVIAERAAGGLYPVVDDRYRLDYDIYERDPLDARYGWRPPIVDEATPREWGPIDSDMYETDYVHDTFEYKRPLAAPRVADATPPGGVGDPTEYQPYAGELDTYGLTYDTYDYGGASWDYGTGFYGGGFYDDGFGDDDWYYDYYDLPDAGGLTRDRQWP